MLLLAENDALDSPLGRMLLTAAAGPPADSRLSGETYDAELWTALSGTAPRQVSIDGVAGGFWRRLYLVADAGGSQYDILRDARFTGLVQPGPVACLALRGRNFHGQRGRFWTVRDGNLHLSLALPVDLPADRFSRAMILLPAVAAADALLRLGCPAEDVRFKWVNDVLLQGKKIAGSLTALRSESGRIRAVFLGLGLNVTAAPPLAAAPVPVGPTCLADVLGGTPPPLARVLTVVLETVAARFTDLVTRGPDPLLAVYRAGSAVLGRRVAVYPPDLPDIEPEQGWPPPLRTGTVLGLNDDLSLILGDDPKPVRDGRLAFLD